MREFAPEPLSGRSGAALVAAASGASVAALGGLVVAGWLTVAVALIQVLPGFPPMQYNTALGFMICGAALLSAALDLERPTALLGGLSGTIGLATLAQHLFQTDLGIDQLLVETYIWTGVPDPGRMGLNSALCLTLIGAGLISLAWRRIGSRHHVCPALLGAVVVALGTAALVGYAAGVPGAYGWNGHNPMAVHTAIGFTLLGGGIAGLAWNTANHETGEAPAWLPVLAAAVVLTVTLCMWYALTTGGDEVARHGQPAAGTATLPKVTLATGVLTAILLAWSIREGQISRRRALSLETANRALNDEIQTRIEMEEGIQQLAAIVESTDDAVLTTALDGTIATWNPGAERLYGYTRSEAVGKPVSILHGHTQDGADLFRRIANDERVTRLETLNVTKDGRRIDVSLTVSPIKDQTGTVVSASTIARDITDRKLLDRMKDDFVGTVSHELRTPLTAIRGFIELVADGEAGPVTETQREFLQIAARNSDKLGVLINDLIDMNLIESRRLDIRRGPLDLTEVLSDVASTFRTMAQSKGLAFREEVQQLPRIYGDGRRLVQVFSNLISNAIKYTPGGEVGISAAPGEHGVEVTVHDSGIGLTLDEQAQLFTRFFRGRSPVVTEAGGTGLGLVIAKAIIERHEGTITVESQVGKGTRFLVTLPASPAASPA
jgi:PAS domain S-box-containing protein